MHVEHFQVWSRGHIPDGVQVGSVEDHLHVGGKGSWFLKGERIGLKTDQKISVVLFLALGVEGRPLIIFVGKL